MIWHHRYAAVFVRPSVGTPCLARRASGNRYALEPLESRTLLSSVTDTVFDDSSQKGVAPVDAFSAQDAGSISGTLYNDNTGNGHRDPSDAPLAGRTVYVDANANRQFDTGERFAATGQDGTYLIDALLSGQHTVRQVLPPGWVQTYPCPNDAGHSVDLVDNVRATGRDFLSWVPVYRVMGYVFDDFNGNGVHDTGENLLVPGRTVFVDADADDVLDAGESSFTTEGYGFEFTHLSAGPHDLGIVVPNGFRESTPPSARRQLTSPYVVPLSSQAQPVRIGLSPVPVGNSISGRVVHDFSSYGTVGLIEPWDSGEAGRKVYIDANDNRLLDAGEVSTTTNRDGSYRFLDVPDGTHRVRLLPSGDDAQTVPAEDASRLVNLTAGQIVTGQDFGMIRIGTVTAVQGVVFEDLNRSGFQEYGEPDIRSATVWWDLNNDGLVQPGEPSITTSGGYYSIDDPGVATAVLRCSYDSATHRLTVPAGGAYTVTRPAGQAGVFWRPFGIVPLGARVSGWVYSDFNGNGVRELDEQGMHAWTVYLDQNDNDARDAGEPAVQTQSGYYSFDRLPAGRHVVRAEGRVATPSTATYVVTLDTNDVVSGIDFGINYRTPGFVRGRFFNDADGDGVREPGETPRAGQAVRLYQLPDGGAAGANTLVATTTTDADGRYGFGLLAGTDYRVEVDAAGGLLTGKGLLRINVSPGEGLEDAHIGLFAAPPAWLAAGSAAMWDAGTRTLTVTGVATIVADPGDDAPLIIATGAAALLTINPAGAATQVNVASLTLTGGATATLTDAAAEHVLVLHAGGVNISGAGSGLNMTDNAMVVKGGTLANVKSLITSGFAGGTWAGGGIRSSNAAADVTAALGYASMAQLGANSFLGVGGLAAADVVVRYTWYGDTNLDRLVNTDDIINILAAGKLDSALSANWFEGDMTFDGLATTDDVIQLLSTGRLDQS